MVPEKRIVPALTGCSRAQGSVTTRSSSGACLLGRPAAEEARSLGLQSRGEHAPLASLALGGEASEADGDGAGSRGSFCQSLSANGEELPELLFLTSSNGSGGGIGGVAGFVSAVES